MEMEEPVSKVRQDLDATTILKLQDKLDSLKAQVHEWKAKAKGEIFKPMMKTSIFFNIVSFQFSSKKGATISIPL